MSMVLCDKSDITAIADKIRAAKGTTEKMTMKEIIENCGGNSSGGGGSVSLATGNFSVSTDMYEPGVNEYVLTSNELKADSRALILVGCTTLNGAYDDIVAIFKKDTNTNTFVFNDGCYSILRLSHTSGEPKVDSDSTIRLYGAPESTNKIETMFFIAV